MLQEYLETRIKQWEFVGHPALMERFVVRNGKSYTGVKRIGRKGVAKACYMNAARRVMDNPGWRYVEGYAINRKQPIMAIEHAWVTTDGTDAMDPTLEAGEYDYFGVEFDAEALRLELLKNETYGLLDHGAGLNHELMFRLDPELEAIVKAVKQPSFAL